MRRFFLSFLQSGQTVVELLVAIGIAALFLPVLISSFVASREGRPQQGQRLQAVTLMTEAQEAVRSVREKGWTTFAVNGTFYPKIADNNSWSLVPGIETTSDGFSRQIVIDNLYRDSNGNIVASGGSLDPSTKKVVTTVSWSKPYSSSIESTSYIARYDNLVYTESTDVDFNKGTVLGTTVTTAYGNGEVILGAGGKGDWCKPNLSIQAVDLPKQGVANAISAIEGHVFAGTGDNASGVSYATVEIANTNPPTGSINGTFDGFKTNGVFGETNYAYLATDTNSKEIEIVDLTKKDANNKYQEAGYFNAPGNGTGNSVYVANNVGYMTDGNKFYTFDLSSKSGDRGSPLGSATLVGTGNKIVVIGSNAYVAISSLTTQLQIINVTDPRNLSIKANISVKGQGAKDVFVNQTQSRAYLVTGASSSQNEFFIIDLTQGNYPVLGSYDTAGMDPKGITVVTGGRAILVGNNGEEYQVVSIVNESSPAHCGGLNIDTGVNGVSSVIEKDGDSFSYIITGDANAELKIIEGGPGGQFTTSGTYTSATFDPGYQTAFNRLQVTANRPPQADLQFQVSVVDPINGSCNGVSFIFVGPDGTSNSYFTTSVTNGSQQFAYSIPTSDDGVGYENPGRCFRYKAYLSTTDATQTPIIYDVSVNYSP